mgnify:CR=1 FL=1
MSGFAGSTAQAWERHNTFAFSEKAEELVSCRYAEQFSRYVEEQYQAAAQNPSHIALNQALLQVCKKYWEWFYVIPKSHRHVVDGRKHRCVHLVFREAYEKLKALEMMLQPPILYLPPPPPPPASPVLDRFSGVTLGEVIGEEA